MFSEIEFLSFFLPQVTFWIQMWDKCTHFADKLGCFEVKPVVYKAAYCDGRLFSGLLLFAGDINKLEYKCMRLS